jgi:hypothetical protein
MLQRSGSSASGRRLTPPAGTRRARAVQPRRRSRAATGPHQRGGRRSARGRPVPHRDCRRDLPAPASRSERSSPTAVSRPSRSASRTIACTRVGPSPAAAAIFRIETPSACALAIAHVRSSSAISRRHRHGARASATATRAATPAATRRCRSTQAPRGEDRAGRGRTVRKTERLSAVFCSVTTPTPGSLTTERPNVQRVTDEETKKGSLATLRPNCGGERWAPEVAEPSAGVKR